MHKHLQSHFKAALRVLRYLKGAPRTRVQFYKSNVLNVKVFSDADWAKCPVTRKNVYGFVVSELFPVEVFNNSSSAIQIASNPLFQEKTKHFEIDVHLVREKLLAGVIKTVKIHTSDQIVDIFTKGLSIVLFNSARVVYVNIGKKKVGVKYDKFQSWRADQLIISIYNKLKVDLRLYSFGDNHLVDVLDLRIKGE
ncbi:hypothetical protein Tco_1280988, partial [Tanacetum coccineum]